jgi:hypothetical protein
MAWTVTVLSPVVGSGTHGDPYRPQLSDDFPPPQYAEITEQDVSQPTDPPLMVVTVVVDAPAMFDGNPDYFVMDVVEVESGEPEISEG